MSVLKAATAAHHDRVEDAVGIEGRCRSRDSYAALLRAMTALYAPLERRIGAVDGLAAVLGDLDERRKTPWLLDDLAALGVAPPAREHDGLPELPDCDTALGACYVLEGATLGGAGIARVARARLGVTATSGAAFFTSYGPQRGARWRAFAGALDARAAGRPERERLMVAGALATFESFAAGLGRDDATGLAA